MGEHKVRLYNRKIKLRRDEHRVRPPVMWPMLEPSPKKSPSNFRNPLQTEREKKPKGTVNNYIPLSVKPYKRGFGRTTPRYLNADTFAAQRNFDQWLVTVIAFNGKYAGI